MTRYREQIRRLSPIFLIKQLFMVTALNNVAVVENEYQVGPADSAETVRDDKARAAFEQLFQGFLYQALRAGVYA
jgi:hypothetical protein